MKYRTTQIRELIADEVNTEIGRLQTHHAPMYTKGDADGIIESVCKKYSYKSPGHIKTILNLYGK